MTPEIEAILARARISRMAKSGEAALRAHIAALEKERDAALADNAALLKALGVIAPLDTGADLVARRPDATVRVTVSISAPPIDGDARHYGAESWRDGKDAMLVLLRGGAHPGAALLEELETLRGRQALWEEAATALYGYTEFIGPCAHGRDPWDRCDECGEKNAVYAAQKVIVKMTEEYRNALEARDGANAGLLATLKREREERAKALVRARNEGLEEAAGLLAADAARHRWTDAGEIRAMKEPE